MSYLPDNESEDPESLDHPCASAPFIMIRRQPYEEPYHLDLILCASNGVFSGTLEYYCSADDLTEVGTRLAEFPKSASDMYVYELGSPRPEDRFAFHLLLRAYAVNAFGRCVLQVTMNSNPQRPEQGCCSFPMSTEASALNRLGRLLIRFGDLKHSQMRWTENGGDLLV